MLSTSDKQYLQSLIREGEHQQQDFKYRVSDAQKLAKSVSAFANTDGGRLLIGVRDDGNMSGVRSEEEIYMMHQAAYRYCSPESSIRFDTYHVDGRTIVVVTVPPSDRRPIYAIGDEGVKKAYIRIADENIVASPVHLALWRASSVAGAAPPPQSDRAPLPPPTPQGHFPPGPPHPLPRHPVGIH